MMKCSMLHGDDRPFLPSIDRSAKHVSWGRGDRGVAYCIYATWSSQPYYFPREKVAILRCSKHWVALIILAILQERLGLRVICSDVSS